VFNIFQSQNALKIYLTWARPGEGKSADAARLARKLFKQYRKVEKRYPDLPRREYWTNQRLSADVEHHELKRDPATGEVINPDGHLCYWDNPKQLRELRNVDIGIDEVGNYFPADGWSNLPRWLRAMFAQHRKRGLRVFANTQDYKGVDINFRRMVGVAYKVQKLFSSRDISATLPPPKSIYGLVIRHQYDPEQLEEEGSTSPTLRNVTAVPTLFWLGKNLIKFYDTTQDIPAYLPDALEHEVKTCPICGKVHVSHRAM